MSDYTADTEENRRRDYHFQALEWNKKVKKMFNHGKVINGVNLSYDTVFGINYTKIHKNLLNVGEGYIIFSVGTSVVIKDLQTKTSKFYTKENRLRNVTCLNAAYEKDENIVLAIGESTPTNEEKAAYVTIINTKENKWSFLNTNMRARIEEIVIETEKKYCAVLVSQFQTLAPQILFWNYQKEKIIGQASIKVTTVDKMTFVPNKSKQLLIQTSTYVKVWELNTQEKTIKDAPSELLKFKKESNTRILDHCWLPHGNNPILLILGNNNTVYILQNDVLKKTHIIDTSQMSFTGVATTQETNSDDMDEYLLGLDDKIADESALDSPKTPKSSMHQVSIQGLEFCCITPTKKGFILGGTKGVIGFYEIEKSLTITNALSYQCPNPDDAKVIFMSSNQGDSITSVVTVNNSDGKFNYYLLNIFQIDSGTSPIQPFFPTGFHNMAVTSMSVCRSRAILATSSDDGYIRLWNYFENEVDEKKGMISHYFKDLPLSVSLHPCSQFLAVAFGNCYKIFAILNDSLHALTTVNLTSCKLVKYTNGGHYLIANERSNIVIYNTIYYDQIHKYEAHTSLIKDFVITEDDKSLISTCEGGFVYFWSLIKFEVSGQKEWQHRNTMYSKILYDHENDLMYGCTAEKPICIYSNNCKDKIAEFIMDSNDFDTRAAVLSLKHQVVFTGTNKGTIKIFLWPMNKESFEIEAKTGQIGTFVYKFPEFLEYNAHLKPITYLEVSHDGNYLFSGAADGSILIFKIHSVNYDYTDTGKPGEKEEKQKFGALTNEIYLEKISKIKEQNEHIKKLQFEVTKSKQTIKIEIKKIEMMCKSKIDQINQEFNTDMQTNSQKKETFVDRAVKDYETCLSDYDAQKARYAEELLKAVEVDKFKEEYEIQRNKDVQAEILRIKGLHQKTLSEMAKRHKQELLAIKRQYQQKCEQVQDKYNNVVDHAKSYGVYFLQKLEKNESDCEKENEEKTKELIDAIAQEKQINSHLQGINAKLASKHETEKRTDENKQAKLNEVIAKNNKLKEENISHMAALLKMHEQLLEREEVILSKEETCKSARDEQINLENFRYLLYQKIQHLTNEKEAMLDKISQQERILKETFQELNEEANNNDKKHEKIKKKETKIRVMNTELKKVDMEIIALRNRLGEMVSNIDKVLGTNEKGKWGPMLKDMLLRSSQSASAGGKAILKRDLTDKEILEILRQAEDKAYDVNDELLKQAKWLTKKLYLFNVTGRKRREMREGDIQLVLAQNGRLIEECKELRNENVDNITMMKFLEKVVQDGMKKKKKQENTSTTSFPMKQNKSQIKLEKIPKDATGEEASPQLKTILTKNSSGSGVPDTLTQSHRQFGSAEKPKATLSGKLSPQSLTKKLSPLGVGPQSNISRDVNKAFLVQESQKEGEEK